MFHDWRNNICVLVLLLTLNREHFDNVLHNRTREWLHYNSFYYMTNAHLQYCLTLYGAKTYTTYAKMSDKNSNMRSRFYQSTGLVYAATFTHMST